MVTETLPEVTLADLAQSVKGQSSQAPALFTYEATKDKRLVARLIAFASEGQGIRVAAEIYPVHGPDVAEPQWQFHEFPTRDRAQRFAEEALIALEYLGCTVTTA